MSDESGWRPGYAAGFADTDQVGATIDIRTSDIASFPLAVVETFMEQTVRVVGSLDNVCEIAVHTHKCSKHYRAKSMRSTQSGARIHPIFRFRPHKGSSELSATSGRFAAAEFWTSFCAVATCEVSE